MLVNKLLVSLRRSTALLLDQIGTRWRNNFYIFVAVIFSVVAIVDVFTVNMIVSMRNRSFDAMVKYRVRVPAPASDIVIVDIDEKSLAELAPEFGRWPWPRMLFGEFVEKLEEQNPSAVVFDILFSDPDVYNSESDTYFNEAIAATNNTWFPMLRLNAAADRESKLTLSRLPGATSTKESDTNAVVAAVLPFFESIQHSARVGFNNIYPDPDGVCREYPVRYREHGYIMPSLPAAVIQDKFLSRQVPDKILLNWRGKPFTYKHVSFSEVYNDMRTEHPQRPADEFSGKTVIIGSTAPSLFDIKTTAVDKMFPGVEILATAIDNLHRGDWLRVPRIPFFYLLVTLMILWLTAIGFYRRAGKKLDQLYGVSQFLLIAVAYTVINIFNVYINLVGPVMFGFVYYSLARYYSFATARALDNSVVCVDTGRDDARGFLLTLHFDLPTREEQLIARLAELLIKECTERPSAEWLSGRQRGFWRLFENTLFICWRTDKNSADRMNAIRLEADRICSSINSLLNRKPLYGVLPFDRLSISRAEGSISGRDDDDWRMLMGTALVHQQGGKKI